MKTFFSKAALVKRAIQTKRLDKLYEKLKANDEFNKISEISYDDAMRRQYKPTVDAVTTPKATPTGLLAIEGPKNPAMVTAAADNEEEERKVTNLELVKRLLMERLADSDNDKSKYFLSTDGNDFFINDFMPVTLADGGEMIVVKDKEYYLSSDLIKILTSNSVSGRVDLAAIVSYLNIIDDAGLDQIGGKKYAMLKSYGIVRKNNDWLYVNGEGRKEVIYRQLQSRTKVSSRTTTGSGLLPFKPIVIVQDVRS